MEARIEILDRLSKRYGKHIEVENFEDLIMLCDNRTIIIVVRLAMAEYANQESKHSKAT
jgi:hypothetical protein